MSDPFELLAYERLDVVRRYAVQHDSGTVHPSLTLRYDVVCKEEDVARQFIPKPLVLALIHPSLRPNRSHSDAVVGAHPNKKHPEEAHGVCDWNVL